MAAWRVLFNRSVSLLPINSVAGIDPSGIERSHASKHYRKRVEITIQHLNVILLVDTKINAPPRSTPDNNTKPDSQIALFLTKRNPESIAGMLGDERYDDQKIRLLACQHEVHPLIKCGVTTPHRMNDMFNP